MRPLLRILAHPADAALRALLALGSLVAGAAWLRGRPEYTADASAACSALHSFCEGVAVGGGSEASCCLRAVLGTLAVPAVQRPAAAVLTGAGRGCLALFWSQARRLHENQPVCRPYTVVVKAEHLLFSSVFRTMSCGSSNEEGVITGAE